MLKHYNSIKANQSMSHHYRVGAYSPDDVTVTKIVTFGGYVSRKARKDAVEMFITPRGTIYYLANNPESTRLCYKHVCAPKWCTNENPLTRRNWIYDLVMAGVPQEYIDAFSRRYGVPEDFRDFYYFIGGDI